MFQCLKSYLVYAILLIVFFCPNFSIAAVDHIDGLEYVVKELDSKPLGPLIHSRYTLYELYFENRSDKAFSIPGYSVDLGVSLTTLQQINAEFKSMSTNKLAVLNLAAGAASIALGGIAKTATNTAFRAVNFKNMSGNLTEENLLLSTNKTYILYPNDALSLYAFIDRKLDFEPKVLRFICHDEESNMNYIVINDHFTIRNEDSPTYDAVNAKVIKDESNETSKEENVIAVPDPESYK